MTYRSRFLTALLLAAPIVMAQQQKKNEQEVNDPKTPQEAVQGAGAPVDPKTYRIGPEDIIGIKVWREPELTGALMVRPDGMISMPLIGELKASGSTPDELGKAITEALLKHMNRAEVFVSVQQVNSKKFYMTGEINRPGQYPLITETNVLQAISAAGGLREYANKKKIVIVRGDQRLKFNYKEVVEGKNLKQNVTLENGDHIIIP
ncbi:MAG: polysaccharide biosynthesis/export family protein [Bryobacteraceae bacterium]|nr:polysaccharide biosynthesis/export family protein [Bryobacteraceae bacterium]